MKLNETFQTSGVISRIYPKLPIKINDKDTFRWDFEIRRIWRDWYTGEDRLNYLHFCCYPSLFKKMDHIEVGDEVEVRFSIFGYERGVNMFQDVWDKRVFNWLYAVDIKIREDTSFSIEEWRKRQAEMNGTED